jgi:hypothetical protein
MGAGDIIGKEDVEKTALIWYCGAYQLNMRGEIHGR